MSEKVNFSQKWWSISPVPHEFPESGVRLDPATEDGKVYYERHWSPFYAAQNVRKRLDLPVDQKFLVTEVHFVQEEVCPICEAPGGTHLRWCSGPRVAA